MVRVSIITPCYNSEKTIRRTFDSMLHQTYQNIEYIVIDGGSTDSTLKIIKEYERLFPFEFKYISEPDNGIYDAMNKGIKMSGGDIIGIVNSDDYYELDALESIINQYHGEKNRILYGIQRNIKNGTVIKAFINHHTQLRSLMITHPTCFVTKNLYNEIGLYNTSFKSSADYEWMLRVFDLYPDCFVPIYKVISNFEVNGMSSTQRGVRETLKIRHTRGYISKYKYFTQLMKSYLYEVLVERRKK